jgi:hypothetical protein
MTDVDWKGAWEIGWPREAFLAIRDRPDFHALVTLARLTNVLRFAQHITATLPDGPPTAQRRQMMNAFYLAGALLVEAEKTIQGAARQFSDEPTYRSLTEVIHSPAYRDVVARFRKLRNWAVFHFDTQVATEGLSGIEDDFVRFVSGSGALDKDIYYDLGDQVALRATAGVFESETSFVEWLSKTADAVIGVTRALDEVIVASLRQRDAMQRQLPSKETMVARKPKRYYVTAGLLYPSALGAAFAWLVPAAPAAIASSTALWALLFASWFVLYHSAWFVHLVGAADESNFEYGGYAFASDLIDVVAVFVGFLCLGLTTPEFASIRPPWVYATALLVPLSAIVDKRFRLKGGARLWLTLVAGVIVAGILIPRANGTSLVGTDWWILGGLFVLLIVYFVVPTAFNSHRVDSLKKRE